MIAFPILISLFFFLNNTAPPEISPFPLPDALPISRRKICEFREPPLRAGDSTKAVFSRSDRGPKEIRCLRRRIRSGRQQAAADPRLDMPLVLRSEEHTSELQSQSNLVCRLLLEKKK